MLPGENVYDRPDLTARVFKLKHEHMMDMLENKKVLGEVCAHNTAFEWQKRKGLPHSHTLETMEGENKPKFTSMIATVISAEIPDQKKCPDLFDVIMKNNRHGPCGPYNNHCPCVKNTNGKFRCTKSFPKDFCKETVVVDGSFPIYRRRSPLDGGATAIIWQSGKQIVVDNSWIIPYNPFLSHLLKCHVNIEVVNSVNAMKYLYKYITKGPDRAIVKVSVDNPESMDEVETFLNTRYLGAGEAAWNILGFSLHHRSYVVEKLALHLEDEQMVTLSEDNTPAAAVENGPPETKLTAYFKLNQIDVEARQYVYPDIPRHYVWHSATKSWAKRKRGGGKVIGRIPTVGVSIWQMERFCLRLLLHKLKGAISFEDLRTVHGEIFPTFKVSKYNIFLVETNFKIYLKSHLPSERLSSIEFLHNLTPMDYWAPVGAKK